MKIQKQSEWQRGNEVEEGCRVPRSTMLYTKYIQCIREI